MKTHQCSMSLRCKSTTCTHAKPHDVKNCGCDLPAPCGSWPSRRSFMPTVTCIPIERVKPLEDCPDCGKKEEKGHHFGDCIRELKRQSRELAEDEREFY